MSLVLMEELKPNKAKRKHTLIYTIQILRPIVKLARLTYRSSRYVLRQCVGVIRKVTVRQVPVETPTPRKLPSNNSH